jgi:signal transduction histidine kinase
MSADVFQEGRAERYLYNVGINILDGIPAARGLGENATFLSQLPTENTLCGFGLGSGTSKTLLRTEHAVRLPLVATDGRSLGTLQLSQGLAFGSKIIAIVMKAWTYAGLVAVAVAAGSGWWISSRLIAPLSDLTDATERMAAGDLAARVTVASRDEFGLLGRSFNGMATRVQEMVATLRSFVADAAHELHTPLTTLRVNLDLAAEDPAHLGDYLRPALSQVQRLQALVDSLLDLSRIEVSSTERMRFSLSSLVSEIAEEYKEKADEVRLDFISDLPTSDVAAVGDTSQIRRAVKNLLDNAFKFTSPGGAITLSLSAMEESAQIIVSDTGIGIPPEELPRLFRRFHRGRNAADYPGSGLGLAIVKVIVDRHHGRVEVASDSRGTRITVVIPIR